MNGWNPNKQKNWLLARQMLSYPNIIQWNDEHESYDKNNTIKLCAYIL